jgi:ADP-heptose:LPS heptosyltransferase
MRYQALGDLVITLPYLLDLKRQFPDTILHLITREEVSAIPRAIKLFDEIIVVKGGRNAKLQFFHSLLLLPRLLRQRYDVVLDLQNHRISKIIRRLLNTSAWVEFDRESPIAAGERTRETIERLWTWKIKLATGFEFNDDRSYKILKDQGWQNGNPLVVLNPAGYCASRAWPTENYIAFAKQWLSTKNPLTQFVLLLLPAHAHKAKYIADALGANCIDLTGKTNQVEAFTILQKVGFVLSEDSGLMHMAWVQGIPTIALFSSSRKDWSAPQGKWSFCFDSSDMECGPCMLEVCKFEDNRCLTRISPSMVLKKADELIATYAH